MEIQYERREFGVKHLKDKTRKGGEWRQNVFAVKNLKSLEC